MSLKDKSILTLSGSRAVMVVRVVKMVWLSRILMETSLRVMGGVDWMVKVTVVVADSGGIP